jgi:hypothetical protein
MPFYATSIYKIALASSITKVAIGKRLGYNDTTRFLFTGGAEPLMMPLSGDRQGNAFKLDQAGSASYLVVEDPEFEVDSDSLFKSAHVDEPLGALLVTDVGIAVTANVKTGSWPSEVVDVYFDDDGREARSPTLERACFKKWRAVRRLQDQIVLIAEFESNTLGNR